MNNSPEMVPKVHPATREMLPEDPLDLRAFEVQGDPAVMLQFIVEEYARMGAGVETILELARNPFYQALHGLWLHFGEQAMCERVATFVRRGGVMRVRTVERNADPPQLVQIAVQSPTAGCTLTPALSQRERGKENGHA